MPRGSLVIAGLAIGGETMVNRGHRLDRGFGRLEENCRPAARRSSATATEVFWMPPAPLKLIALDADDLAVISAQVQDARVRTYDIIWRQNEKRLVVGMNRLDWEQTLAGEASPRRLVAALRFDRVLACKSRNIDLASPQAPLELLGIEFYPGAAPGGSALLLFSHGGALRLDVECLECELTDLGTDDVGVGDGVKSSGSGA
jgi:Protein of unknown function (DUF2948)